MLKTGIIVVLLMLVAPLGAWSGEDGIILRDMQGRRVYVDSLLQEGPVVLNFWATWCKPCRLEIPHLETIYKQLAPEKVHFAAISLDNRRHKKQIEEYLTKYKITIPAYRDPDGTLGRRLKVMAIPTTIVLDQKGEIHFRTRGYRAGDEIMLRKKIEELIRKDHEPQERGDGEQQLG